MPDGGQGVMQGPGGGVTGGCRRHRGDTGGGGGGATGGRVRGGGGEEGGREGTALTKPLAGKRGWLHNARDTRVQRE